MAFLGDERNPLSLSKSKAFGSAAKQVDIVPVALHRDLLLHWLVWVGGKHSGLDLDSTQGWPESASVVAAEADGIGLQEDYSLTS